MSGDLFVVVVVAKGVAVGVAVVLVEIVVWLERKQIVSLKMRHFPLISLHPLLQETYIQINVVLHFPALHRVSHVFV